VYLVGEILKVKIKDKNIWRVYCSYYIKQ